MRVRPVPVAVAFAVAVGIAAVIALAVLLPQDDAFELPKSPSQSGLPLLKLDYSTYSAAQYDEAADIYTFKNIRYAAPPTGSLRWKKPQPPPFMAEVQDGSEGAACLQLTTLDPQSDDCLFLDLYVPGRALENSNSKLPVVVWIHGGSNTSGSKDLQNGFFYNGTGPIQGSNNSMIFIAANYRLGPWGFLSGTTLERTGLPNAGLHDIRAVFQWVQDYISFVGGDRTQVSAWGESAGATNLFHLLVAQGGTLDPLFSKAILMSPSVITDVDRGGLQETCFQNFTSLADCKGQGVECLRRAPLDALQSAAEQLEVEANPFCSGTAADGTFIRQAAGLEFANNFYWKGLDSIIVTHTANEGALFVPNTTETDADFVALVAPQYPQYAIDAGVLDSVLRFYPGDDFGSEFDRASVWTRDISFGPAVWALHTYYLGKSWAAQYSIGEALHASDLTALFWQQNANPGEVVRGPLSGAISPPPSNINELASTYQSYMASHAIFGNPNTAAMTGQSAYPAMRWPMPENVTSGPLMTDVLNFGNQSVSLIDDNQMPKAAAEFQAEIYAAVTNLGGWAVPGTVVSSQGVVNGSPSMDPSRNYVDNCEECREG